MDVAVHKQRLFRMLAIDGVCAAVAMVAAVLAVRHQADGLWGLFAAALVAGFAAQIWFIAGFVRANKGA